MGFLGDGGVWCTLGMGQPAGSSYDKEDSFALGVEEFWGG